MHSFSVYKATQLSPADRREEIRIHASLPIERETASQRDQVWDLLGRHLDRMASKVTHVEEAEHLADELSREVRHGRP